MPNNEYEAVEKGTLHLLTLEIDRGPASVEGTVKKAQDSYGDNTVAFDVTFKAPVAVDVN